MCECCVARTVPLATLFPGWLLIQATKDGNDMKDGDFGLVECNSPTFIFCTTPWPDPIHEWEDERINALTEANWENEALEIWMDQAEEFEKELVECDSGLDAVGRLVEACHLAGNPKGHSTAHWLFHYMGTQIPQTAGGLMAWADLVHSVEFAETAVKCSGKFYEKTGDTQNGKDVAFDVLKVTGPHGDFEIPFAKGSKERVTANLKLWFGVTIG